MGVVVVSEARCVIPYMRTYLTAFTPSILDCDGPLPSNHMFLQSCHPPASLQGKWNVTIKQKGSKPT